MRCVPILAILIALSMPSRSPAISLVVKPGSTERLVPDLRGTNFGFDYQFSDQNGSFIVEDFDRSSILRARTTLDFDGRELGEPSWLIDFADPNGLVNINRLFDAVVIPPDVSPDGDSDTTHTTLGSGRQIWSYGEFTLTSDGNGYWLSDSHGISHATGGPPPPPFPPASIAFANQTGGPVTVSVSAFGDTNHDGLVNIEDLNNVRNNFGGMGRDDGSLDGDAYPYDGNVDIGDLNSVRNNFGARAVAIPEPMSFLLVAFGSSLMLLCRLR